MKSFTFIIFLVILMSQYECINECGGDGSSKKDCNSRNLKENEYRCCYYYYEFAGKKNQECIALSRFEYDNFDTYIKTYETIKEKADDFSFDCNSDYVIISMFSLLLLLFYTIY